MTLELSRKAKVAYAIFLIAISGYLFFTEQLSFRKATFEGLELKILGAAALVGAVNLVLEAVFDYQSKSTDHFYKFYHYAFMAITICLIVIAVIFDGYEDQLFSFVKSYSN